MVRCTYVLLVLPLRKQRFLLTYFVVAYCPSVDCVVNDVFSRCVAVYYTETLFFVKKTSTRPKKS